MFSSFSIRDCQGSQSSTPAHLYKRQQRTSIACTNCRSRKIRCTPASGDEDSDNTNRDKPCKRCEKRGLACQYIPVSSDPLADNNRRTPSPTLPQFSSSSTPPTLSPQYNTFSLTPSHTTPSLVTSLENQPGGIPAGAGMDWTQRQTTTPSASRQATNSRSFGNSPNYSHQSSLQYWSNPPYDDIQSGTTYVAPEMYPNSGARQTVGDSWMPANQQTMNMQYQRHLRHSTTNMSMDIASLGPSGADSSNIGGSSWP